MSSGRAMKATPKRKRPNEMSPARLRMGVVYQEAALRSDEFDAARRSTLR